MEPDAEICAPQVWLADGSAGTEDRECDRPGCHSFSQSSGRQWREAGGPLRAHACSCMGGKALLPQTMQRPRSQSAMMKDSMLKSLAQTRENQSSQLFHASSVSLIVASSALQAWANQLAVAESEDATCAIVQELFQAEDIPYGILQHATVALSLSVPSWRLLL